MMLVVLDTNVIVSGILNATGNPGKILDLILNNQIQIAYDDRIINEYAAVLARSEFQLSPAKVNPIITFLELTGRFIEKPEPCVIDHFPDEKDLPFVEVLIASQAQAIVTGNSRHFQALIDHGWLVLTPTQFIEKYFTVH